jgi:hypothetical protein
MSKRHPRFGTPLPPGRRRYLLPEMHLPRNRAAIVLALRRRKIQGRLALGLVGLVVLALVFSFVTAPPPPPNIGTVNGGQSRFGPVRFNAPVGWGVQIGSDDLDTPWVMVAPQNDPRLAPVTITIASVDVTDRLRALAASLASPGPSASAAPINARILLETLTRQALALVARGPFCTLAQSYGSDIGTTGALLPALLVEWQKPIPWGSKLSDGGSSPLGRSTNIGTCPPFVPAAAQTPSPTASASSGAAQTPSPTASASSAAAQTPSPTASASSGASSALGNDFILAAAKATAKPKTPTPKPSLSPSPSSSPSPGLSATPGASPSAGATPSPSLLPLFGSPSARPSGAASPGPASSLPAANVPLMHQVEWFALPAWPGLRSNDTQRMLVLTLTYPDNLSATQIAQARYVFAQLIATINSD